jgi:hypothetical protein
LCGAGCHLSPLSARLEVGELPGDQVQQAGLCHAFNLDAKIEAIEDGACCRKETLNEGLPLSPGVLRAPRQLAQFEQRGVVEALARSHKRVLCL